MAIANSLASVVIRGCGFRRAAARVVGAALQRSLIINGNRRRLILTSAR